MSIQDQLKKVISENKVILFMKGNANAPQCGFSARVVEVLNKHEVPFQTVDVLANAEIRDGIKQYSNWPTIPQLYVNNEFIGGCDIVTELHQNGELKTLLDQAK